MTPFKPSNKNTFILLLAACLLFALALYLTHFKPYPPSDEPIDWQKNYGPVIDHALQSVVAIETDQPSPYKNLTFKNAGSGFFIDSAGLILTNEHIIHNASAIRVTLADRRTLNATLVASDPRSDIALLKIVADTITSLPIAPPDSLAPGQPVIALGNPLGSGADGQAVTTFGHINRLDQRLDASVDPPNDRFYDNLIQSTALTLPGSSGGPLIDTQGRAIGINTATAKTVETGKQFGFAIALDKNTLDLIDVLRSGGEMQHGFVGLELAPQIDETTQQQLGLKNLSGTLVVAAMLGFPAQRAGIKPGDVITAIDNQTLYNREDLISRLNRCIPQKPIQLNLLRARTGEPGTHDEFAISVKPTIRKLDDIRGYQAEASLNYITAWGLAVKPLTDWRKDKLQLPPTQFGVLIYAVQPGSPADQKGILPGAVITAIDNQSVHNLHDFHRIAQRFSQLPTLDFILPDPSVDWF